MISISNAIYIVITLVFVIGLLIHMHMETYGSMFTSGKNKWEIGGWGALLIVVYIVYVLIWGGVFWW